MFLQRLDGGLFQLQELALIITFACVFDTSKDCLTRAEGKLSAASFHRVSEGKKALSGKDEVTLQNVLAVMRDNAAYLRTVQEEGDEKEDRDAIQYMHMLLEWSAALNALIQ